MKFLAARFGHRADHRRALLVFGAEVGHGDFELGDHIRVGIDRRVAVAAGVGDVGPVGGDVQRVAGEAVVGVGVIQRALASGVAVGVDADGASVVVGRVRGSVLDAKPGHHLDELGGVASHLDEVLQLFGGQRRRFFARIDRSQQVCRAGDHDRLGGAADLQVHVHIALLTAAEGDAGFLVGFKTRHGDGQFIRANRNGGERIIALTIGGRLAKRTRALIAEPDGSLGDKALRGIGNDTGECCVNGLRGQVCRDRANERECRRKLP